MHDYLRISETIKLIPQGSPDQTAPGSLEKGKRWSDHTKEAIAHLRLCGYSI